MQTREARAFLLFLFHNKANRSPKYCGKKEDTTRRKETRFRRRERRGYSGETAQASTLFTLVIWFSPVTECVCMYVSMYVCMRRVLLRYDTLVQNLPWRTTLSSATSVRARAPQTTIETKTRTCESFFFFFFFFFVFSFSLPRNLFTSFNGHYWINPRRS